MVFHVFIILVQIAVVAAFLVLWYFWVKRRIGVTYGMDNVEHVLFPFRYFSWILLGVVVLTCMVQVHFVRVSATVHERLASITRLVVASRRDARSLAELKETVAVLRTEMKSAFRGLRDRRAKRPTAGVLAESPTTLSPPALVAMKEKGPVRRSVVPRGRLRSGFASEAKASSMRESAKRGSKEFGTRRPVNSVAHSMPLNLMGRVKASSLKVRRRPQADAVVVEKLTSGRQVKVTEKRAAEKRMWFRIITPSGRAGWVDHRFLKLEEVTAGNT